MHIPLVDLRSQYASIKSEIDSAVQRVLGHAGFILGEEVRTFEQAFSGYVGAIDAVGVSSGTAALHLSLLACGVGAGDEVITTAHTFIATAEAISHTGARPVFVDIDSATFTIDPKCVQAAVTARTRAILPVHLYGQPADLDPLMEIARRHDLFLLEDAAQAHGAEYHGKKCGTFGDLACFSFYPGKNLGAFGDAGAVTGNDPELLGKVRMLRDHGRKGKYDHQLVGYGERLDALQAAILAAKLVHLGEWTEARRRHARQYSESLAGTPLEVPREASGVEHVYHLYVVRAPKRDALLDYLKRRDIGAGIHYPIPLHRQPAYVNQGYGNVTLPQTERAASEVLSLPLYPEITSVQIEQVVRAIKGFYA